MKKALGRGKRGRDTTYLSSRTKRQAPEATWLSLDFRREKKQEYKPRIRRVEHGGGGGRIQKQTGARKTMRQRHRGSEIGKKEEKGGTRRMAVAPEMKIKHSFETGERFWG